MDPWIQIRISIHTKMSWIRNTAIRVPVQNLKKEKTRQQILKVLAASFVQGCTVKWGNIVMSKEEFLPGRISLFTI
jgi:hypothetical protein